MNKTVLCIVCIILLSGCGTTMERSLENSRNTATVFLDDHIGKSKIPGIQYIVMNSDESIFEYADGWADIAGHVPMTVSTTMMAYSMTKTITAAAILQLVDTGQLNLDDSIDLYLSENPYGDAVTIRHLLAQTSGIPNPIPLRWAHVAGEHRDFNESAVLAGVLEENPELSFEPGKKYAYSNISYWLLGKIIETASGKSYQEYVKEHILGPLQLEEHEMGFSIAPGADHAKGYLAKLSFLNLLKGFLIDTQLVGNYEGTWLNINSHYLNGPAFGGLVGSADGFRKFLQDQLGDESVLFSNDTRTLFYSQQKNNAGESVEMTLGWHVGDLDGIPYYFKEGGGAGYHCEMRVYPEQGIASVIIVNKTSFKSRKFLHTLDREFLL